MVIATFDIRQDGVEYSKGEVCLAFTDLDSMYKYWNTQDSHPFLYLNLITKELIPC